MHGWNVFTRSDRLPPGGGGGDSQSYDGAANMAKCDAKINKKQATQTIVVQMIHKNNKALCTMNFHNTTSRIVITGREENTLKFIKDQLPLLNKKITENLDGHGISLSMLNQSTRVSQEKALSSSAKKEHNPSKLARMKPAITDAPSCPVPPCSFGAVAILVQE